MQVSRRAIVISAVVFFSAIGIYVSSSSPSETVVSDAPSTTLMKGCFDKYCIGDSGPGGGTIVYVDEAGFDNSVEDDKSIGAMCMTGTCHYLEMAPTDLEGQYSWDDAIVAAEAFSTSSANDWVLPSKDALNEMCKYVFGFLKRQCSEDGGAQSSRYFREHKYWSSSEFNVTGVSWYQDFKYGKQNGEEKFYDNYVRPVRAF
jgi:hypothetical protein